MNQSWSERVSSGYFSKVCLKKISRIYLIVHFWYSSAMDVPVLRSVDAYLWMKSAFKLLWFSTQVFIAWFCLTARKYFLYILHFSNVLSTELKKKNDRFQSSSGNLERNKNSTSTLLKKVNSSLLLAVKQYAHHDGFFCPQKYSCNWRPKNVWTARHFPMDFVFSTLIY